MICTLCESTTQLFKTVKEKAYFKCDRCRAIMLDPKYYLSPTKEKDRYEEHNNDVEDKGYQSFVSPIVKEVLADYNQSHKGLDFGAGTGPVISKLLRDQGYKISIYDPFFANCPEKLQETYDYIVCCEVIEHFYNPRQEFQLLKSLLNPGGTLYIKTNLYSKDIEFQSWWYRDDPTHVFFYQDQTLQWIQKNHGFSYLKVESDIIILGG